MHSPAPLYFPHAAPPEFGKPVEIAPGVLWLRLALPFALDHINLYLVKDGDGWAAIDTGIGDARTLDAWAGLIGSEALGGHGLTRLIVTHFHPDHVGAAGWLAERYRLPLFMSQTEFLFSLALQLDRDGYATPGSRAFYQMAGLPAETVEQVVGRGHGYLKRTTGLPQTYTRLIAGDRVELDDGGRVLHVLTGGGHSPEQVMLYDADNKLFFAADQVLAKISPNVSVWPNEPDADPLGAYLASLKALTAEIPEDVLVLACHNLPFVGLHRRIESLTAHHAQRCDDLAEACALADRTAAELLPVLFPRALDLHQTSFAVGELQAHLNRMQRTGRLRLAIDTDGIRRYRTQN